MEKIIPKKLIEDYALLAQRHLSFNIRLNKNIEDHFELHTSEQKEILNEIIKPLFYDASDAFLYNDGENELYQKDISNVTEKKGKKYRLKLDEDIFSGLEHFWSGRDGERGTILWVNSLSNISISDILHKTYDPEIISNLHVAMSKSAINYSKKFVEDNENNIVFILGRFRWFRFLTIFLSKKKIGRYIEIALKKSQLSESFLLQNAIYFSK